MDLQLAGRTALVTGASSRGIGQAIAKGLAAEGVQLCIAARRKHLLEQAADEIVAAGGKRPHVVAVDLMEEDGPARLVQEAIAKMGSVNILVNAAGFGKAGWKLDTPEAEWRREFSLIFDNIRKTTLAAIPDMMKHKWGRVLNVTGHLEVHFFSGSATSKAAVHAFSKSLSCEVAQHGITVNCLSPGKIMSEQILTKYTEEQRRKTAEEEIPMRRWGRPEEMANLAVFMASPLSSYITGTIMHVDGGYRRYMF